MKISVSLLCWACWMTLPGVLLLVARQPRWQSVALAQTAAAPGLQADVQSHSVRPIAHFHVHPERKSHLGKPSLFRLRDMHFLKPPAEYSLLGRWLDEIFSPLAADFSAKAIGTSDRGLRLVYALTQESMAWPALGISARAALPETQATPYRQWDVGLNFSATKSLGEDSFVQRIKLSAAWMRNFHLEENDDDEYYTFVLGYECQLGAAAELALNLVHEEQTLKDTTSNFVETGFRYHITPGSLFWVGTGAGIGPDSPAFRGLFGFRSRF